ncbi:MAG: hypothetical protein PHY71_04790 [Bacteroidaceae bacterium]|nr:hypothetical protein [Bacteroidaceae bacterium]
MSLIIKINEVDITNLVNWETIEITDNINEKVNLCNFQIVKKGSQTYVPTIGQEVEIKDGSTFFFAGTIVKISRELTASKIEVYNLECKDWTQEADRYLITERYTNKTVDYIINDLVTNYATDFTDNNVDCPIVMGSITFNNLTLSQCIKKLSEAVNYFWDIDYEKDIHFFAKATKTASFGLTDTNDNYIPMSLSLLEDLSQLRNTVKVKGGEMTGSLRTETFDGDGSKTTFVLANKFSSLPTVLVGGVAKTVGVDHIDAEADFDCFWNYNEKYLRFKVAPAVGSNNISISGNPLIPIIVQVEDIVSVANYGSYEFYIEDTSITSLDEAKQRAQANLEAYGSKLVEGSFSTYTDGLKSGQVINIQSDIREIDESYLIQSVRMTMITPEKRVYNVDVASMRTLGIIYFLQELLLQGRKEVDDDQNDVLYKYYQVNEIAQVTEEISVEEAMEDFKTIGVQESIRKDPFEVIWVLSKYEPVDDNDPKRQFKLNISSYLY